MYNQINRNRKSGVLHWRWQRISAILVLSLMIYCVYLLIGIIPLNYVAAHAFVAMPAVSLPLMILLIAGIYHAALGLQVVIEDYVPLSSGRRGLIISVRLVSGMAAFVSLLSVALIVI